MSETVNTNVRHPEIVWKRVPRSTRTLSSSTSHFCLLGWWMKNIIVP